MPDLHSLGSELQLQKLCTPRFVSSAFSAKADVLPGVVSVARYPVWLSHRNLLAVLCGEEYT
jgi:hypothetical protein